MLGSTVSILAFTFFILPSGDHVHNPSKPEGKNSIQFEEVLRFGGDEDDINLYWPGYYVGITVGGDGTIYVADTMENRILAYDANGEFIKNVGGKGQGPGEWGQLVNFHALSNGQFIIFDYQGGVPRLQLLDSNLKYLKTLSPSESGNVPITIFPSGTPDLLAGVPRQYDFNVNRIHHTYALFDTSFNIKKDIAKLSVPIPDPNKLGQTEHWVGVFGGQLELMVGAFGIVAVGPDGRAYTARADKYEITRWSPDLKEAELVITSDRKPERRSPKSMELLAEKAAEIFLEGWSAEYMKVFEGNVVERAIEEHPKVYVKNQLLGILPMPEGRFLAVTDMNHATGKTQADLFNADGKLIAQTSITDFGFLSPLNYPRMVFHKNEAYTLLTDSEGTNVIARYKVVIK